MRKLFLLVLMLSMGCIGYSALASNDGEPSKDSKPVSPPITIVYIPADVPGAPRSVVPVECEYNTLLQSICVRFLANLGEVDVTIENLTTGEYISGTLNSANGYFVIPISGSQGIYEIRFETLSETFGGTFEI